MQILSAETNTLADDLLLLRYVAAEPESPGQPSPERLKTICQALVDSIDSDTAPKFPKILGREQTGGWGRADDMPNEVRIDSEMSGECTVVECLRSIAGGCCISWRRGGRLHDVGW